MLGAGGSAGRLALQSRCGSGAAAAPARRASGGRGRGEAARARAAPHACVFARAASWSGPGWIRDARFARLENRGLRDRRGGGGRLVGEGDARVHQGPCRAGIGGVERRGGGVEGGVGRGRLCRASPGRAAAASRLVATRAPLPSPPACPRRACRPAVPRRGPAGASFMQARSPRARSPHLRRRARRQPRAGLAPAAAPAPGRAWLLGNEAMTRGGAAARGRGRLMRAEGWQRAGMRLAWRELVRCGAARTNWEIGRGGRLLRARAGSGEFLRGATRPRFWMS